MAFVKGTKIFTDNGWKNIEDIAGRDKVLVRNFLGSAEFIQPFAVTRKLYDGDIVQIGGANWSFSTTPDHIVLYDSNIKGSVPRYQYAPAADIVPGKGCKIHRRFKYSPVEPIKRETIKLPKGSPRSSAIISLEDWYKIVACTITRGAIYDGAERPALHLNVRSSTIEKDLQLYSSIFDKYHIKWSLVSGAKPFVRVSYRNGLAIRLKRRLGSRSRKRMRLPHDMVYHTPRYLAKIFFDTLIYTSTGKDPSQATERQFTTTNKGLIEDLDAIGVLGGYGLRTWLSSRAGEKMLKGYSKNDSYVVTIAGGRDLYTPKYNKRYAYSDYVYWIDLFDGQVYVKEKSMPIWTNPK